MTTGLTVGEFSRMTHLSVKTLRHYHQVGLLEPAEVNSANGYRYYTPEQIPTAQVIRRLRDLDMPVAEVKSVLAANDAGARNVIISSHLDRLEAELVQTRASVESLRNILQQPATANPIQHRTVPAAPALGISDVVDRSDILGWWQGALGELHATARAQHLKQTGPTGGLYDGEIFQYDRGEAIVFLPVSGAMRAVGRVTPFVVPAAELAVIAHHGSLADIDLTYGALGSYAAQHAISVDGPLREYYLRDAHDTADETQWETEIGWPIFRADTAG
jgi:DNA-binding transcriptional MerR regulator/effector-binding domain-containing protein